MKNKPIKNQIVVYQTKSGAIEFKEDLKKQTIWASLQQMADLFMTDKSGISRHIKNIYQSDELRRSATVAKIATVQKEGGRDISRVIEYYNLDMILSVGYRVNSKRATIFRQWATKTLRAHIIDGYTINRSRITKNYETFLKAVEQVKKLLPAGGEVDAKSVLELVNLFADAWFSIDAFDKDELPKKGLTKKQIKITATDLEKALAEFKRALAKKEGAANFFGVDRQKDSVAGIVGNVFQTFNRKNLYPSVEEKAAHLLYFMVKNHPFVDGNKRVGAFAFVWFLKKTNLLNTARLNSTALTALTLLIAESDPQDKEKMVGLILMLLKK